MKKLRFRKEGKKCPKKFLDLLKKEENKGEQNPCKYLVSNALRG
jgi:hypothetical protein